MWNDSSSLTSPIALLIAMQTLTIDSGLRLLAQKQFKKIHTDSIAAIKADVSNPIAYFLLGVIAAEHGNYDKALELYKNS